MWTVPSPAVSAGDAFDACVNGIQDVGLRGRFQTIRPLIVQAAAGYEVEGAAQTLQNVPCSQAIGPVSSDDMRWLYRRRLVRSSPARRIYDALVQAARNGVCPLCGHREAGTLDHSLPLAHYSAHAVGPLNLVPACYECNHVKQDHIPLAPDDVCLHPYFDNVEGCHWLVGVVIEKQPPAIVFTVDSAALPDALIAKRAENHFQKFGLGDLYSAQSANELQAVRLDHINVLRSGGQVALRAHLISARDSFADHDLNWWRTAMYSALIDNGWYLGGGFI